MASRLTRKQFLRDGTKAVAAMAVGAGALSLASRSKSAAGSLTAWPYPYQALDIEVVRNYGHQAYYSGKGCCYGAFYGLVRALAETVGEPYSTFPAEIMLYGSGGGAGWGATCGAANGAAALISLVSAQARVSVLVNELFGWYTQTLFPSDISNDRAHNHTFTENRCDKILQQTSSGSVLCHTSNAVWVKAAGYSNSSTERKERCARLTGDTAAYAAKILNDELAGQFTATYVPPASIAGCMTCHGSTATDTVAAKMECQQCHGNPHVQSSAAALAGPPATYHLSQNYPNPFNPSTRIEFSLPKADRVDIGVYDVHGRLVRELVNYQEHAAGTYSIDWDGRDGDGGKVASGIYFARMQAGAYTATLKMNLVK